MEAVAKTPREIIDLMLEAGLDPELDFAVHIDSASPEVINHIVKVALERIG